MYVVIQLEESHRPEYLRMTFQPIETSTFLSGFFSQFSKKKK